MVTHKQFDIYLVKSDPVPIAIGRAEIKKSRPAIIISPDAINENLKTVIIAPFTHSAKNYPSRVLSNFNNEPGQIALDQMRAIDKKRLTRKLGRVDAAIAKDICSVYKQWFIILLSIRVLHNLIPFSCDSKLNKLFSSFF